MLDQHDLRRLRAAELSPFDIKVLSTFMATGGEFPFYVDRLKPETKDAQIAGMNSLIERDIVRSTRRDRTVTAGCCASPTTAARFAPSWRR